VIIERGFSLDQSRQVNHWPLDRVLANDRLAREDCHTFQKFDLKA
jgi:hypothetical protein